MVEIMIVVALIALMIAISLPNLLRVRMTAQDAAMQAELSSMYKAMAAFFGVNGRFPKDYEELRPYIEVPSFERKYRINPNPL